MSAASPAPARSGLWTGVAIFCAVAALAVALRAPVAGLPLERDEGEYAYIGWRWLEGDLPHRDSFNQKPPGGPAVYALIQALVGGTPSHLRWGAQLYALLTLALLIVLARRLFGDAAALVAGTCAVLLSVDPGLLGNAINTEFLAQLPLVAGVLAASYALERERMGAWVGAGVCAALALSFKPVAAPVGVVLGGASLLATRRGASLAAFVAGGLGVAALVAIYFALRGGLGALVQDTLVFNLAYGSDLSLSDYPRLFARTFGPTHARLWPLFALAGIGFLLCLRAASGSRHQVGSRWALAWLASSLTAVAAGGYFRLHYFLLAAPALALMAGAAVELAMAGARPRVRGATAALLAVVLTAATLASAPWYYKPGDPLEKSRLIYQANPFGEVELAARFLRDHTSAQDEVFVYGSEPQLLYAAERRSASRYIILYGLTLPLPGAQVRQREALAELDAREPRAIVGTFLWASFLDTKETPDDLDRGLRERIERDYELAGLVLYDPDPRGRLVTGEAARALWEKRPLWDRRRPWAAFAIWLRRDP